MNYLSCCQSHRFRSPRFLDNLESQRIQKKYLETLLSLFLISNNFKEANSGYRKL